MDSTAQPEAVFASEVNKLREEKIKPKEQITLEPYERDHAVVVGQYRSVETTRLNLIIYSSLAYFCGGFIFVEFTQNVNVWN